jgi:hypothetical protein
MRMLVMASLLLAQARLLVTPAAAVSLSVVAMLIAKSLHRVWILMSAIASKRIYPD